MDKHLLMKIPIYLLMISVIYSTIKKYKAQKEWNNNKKWNLLGLVIFFLGLILFIYDDFFS